MTTHVFPDPTSLGKAAGKDAAENIREAIRKNGCANIILATGTSQFETLMQLTIEEDIAWEEVTMFHLDEYIGLSGSHPASFRRYLKERFITRIPDLKAIHLINGETDPHDECHRLGELIKNHPIDVALIGIGENGHLAFNDPPADFETKSPYIVVSLDQACRQQQLGEGWFKTIEEVPRQAISMSVTQILKSTNIVCSVPDERKAPAVKNALEGPITNHCPASILQMHPECKIYLDRASARLVEKE